MLYLFKNIYSPNYFLNYFYSCVCHIYAGAYGGQMRTSDLRDLVSCESLDTDAGNRTQVLWEGRKHL